MVSVRGYCKRKLVGERAASARRWKHRRPDAALLAWKTPMRSWFRVVALLILVLIPARLLLADIPGPDGKIPPRPFRGHLVPLSNVEEPKSVTLPFIVTASDKTDTTEIYLPKTTIAEMRAALPPADEDAPRWGGFSSLQTIIVGIALTVATIGGGLWLARSRRRRIVAGVLCFFTACVLVGVSCGPAVVPEYAKLPPPPPRLEMNDKGNLAGRVQIVGDAGDEAQLKINATSLKQVLDQK